MSGKIVTSEGKEFEITTTREELTKHLLESFDELRAGIIDPTEAEARAKLAGKIIANEMLGILSAKLSNNKFVSNYLSTTRAKELPL